MGDGDGGCGMAVEFGEALGIRERVVREGDGKGSGGYQTRDGDDNGKSLAVTVVTRANGEDAEVSSVIQGTGRGNYGENEMREVRDGMEWGVCRRGLWMVLGGGEFDLFQGSGEEMGGATAMIRGVLKRGEELGNGEAVIGAVADDYSWAGWMMRFREGGW
ncbi:unnamed protein product [Calypogeia fissa]